jgi:TRAP-type C4-dicarboxylate transport system permease small subunit
MRAAADLLERLLRAVLALIMGGIVLLNVANVAGRYLLSAPIRGADEAMTFAMVWGVFLGAGLVALRGAHLNMDLVVRLLPALSQRALSAVGLVAMLLILGFVAAASLEFLDTVGAIGLTSMALGLPMAWVHAAVPVGCVLMIAAARAAAAAPRG